MYTKTNYFVLFMYLIYIKKMRPKKHPSELRDVPFHVRLRPDERSQFYAQAKIRGMELGPYLRSLAVDEGERLMTDGRIRCDADGKWEVLLMGKWRAVNY